MRLFVSLAALLSLYCGSAHAASVFPQDVQMCSGRPWIDITCNGADPTGAADSTAALNATFTAAINNGWPVSMPAGTYKVTSKLTVDFAGQASGLEIISRGAVLDGRTIGGAGNVLQLQCSGGTTASPAVCNNLRLTGFLTVRGSTSGYVVALGKTDFSDQLNAAQIDHLVVSNIGTGGGIQANFLTDSDLWLSGSASGGSTSVGAVALEQVQTSRISGYASAVGASAVGLLIENGVTVNNSIAAFAYDPNNATCVSITSATAQRNIWLAPYFSCVTAINAPTSANQNSLLGPSFNVTNVGPNSPGMAMIGRGSLNRFAAPAVSSRTLLGTDDGTIFSAANATGANTQWAAASLGVTLPTPSAVGAGWTAAFVGDAGKAVVVIAPAGQILSGNQRLTSMTVGASGSWNDLEIAVLKSDGANWRVEYISRGAALLNGLETAWPTRWYFPGGPGYQLTAGDNGGVISSLLAGALQVVFPQNTVGFPLGWTVAISGDATNPITITPGAAGAVILADGTTLPGAGRTFASTASEVFAFDGTSFRQRSSAGYVIGQMARFTDNRIGAFAHTAEGAGVGVTSHPAYTAQQIADWVLCDCVDPVSYDAVRGVGILTPGSSIDLVTGAAGYVASQVPFPGLFPTAIALFGMGIADVDGAAVWGINTALSDNRGQVLTNNMNRIMINELDLNFTSPHSSGIGLQVAGGSLAQAGFSLGLVCANQDGATPVGSVAKWSICNYTNDAASDYGASFGTKTVLANSDGQAIQLRYRDASNAVQSIAFNANFLPAISFANTKGASTLLSGVGIATPSGSDPSMSVGLTIGYFSGTPPTGGSPITGLPTSKHSASANFLYTDSSGTLQAMGLQTLGGDVPTLTVISSSSRAYLEVGTSIYASWPNSCINQPHNTIWNNAGVASICP